MAAKNKKLGRGLDAIFGEGIENVLNDIEVPKGVATSQTEISIKDIHTSQERPLRMIRLKNWLHRLRNMVFSSQS